jgi:hypothetical protein
MRTKTGVIGLAVLCAVVFVWVLTAWRPAPGEVVKGRKTVGLQVIAMRGSREGEEQDDSGLDEISKKIKKKLKLKRLEPFGQTHFAATSGLKLTTKLGEDMEIEMKWRGVQKDVAKFRIIVTRNKATIIKDDVSMKLTKPAVCIGKMGKEVLILLMKADLKDD